MASSGNAKIYCFDDECDSGTTRVCETTLEVLTSAPDPLN